MKSIIKVIILLILTPYIMYAQINIKGNITDNKTGEAVPFASIGISGSTVGTVSNSEGNFKLQIPATETSKDITVSSIGYEQFILRPTQYRRSSNINIELVPLDYRIDEVVVEDKDYFPYLVVRRASDNIARNYPQTPHNYKVFYENITEKVSSEKFSRKAIALLYDAEGYRRSDFYSRFVNRNYRFLESKRNFEARTPHTANTKLDDLLSFDIVGSHGNVLDKHQLNKYELSISQETVYDRDSVWIVEFSNSSPDLLSTGFYYPTSYSGQIIIAKNTYAVLKVDAKGELSNLSNLGRDLYIPENGAMSDLGQSLFEFSTKYKKNDNLYHLSEITYSLEVKKPATAHNSIKNIHAVLQVLEYECEKTEVIAKRDYFENKQYNKTFWDVFLSRN